MIFNFPLEKGSQGEVARRPETLAYASAYIVCLSSHLATCLSFLLSYLPIHLPSKYSSACPPTSILPPNHLPSYSSIWSVIQHPCNLHLIHPSFHLPTHLPPIQFTLLLGHPFHPFTQNHLSVLPMQGDPRSIWQFNFVPLTKTVISKLFILFPPAFMSYDEKYIVKSNTLLAIRLRD